MSIYIIMCEDEESGEGLKLLEDTL